MRGHESNLCVSQKIKDVFPKDKPRTFIFLYARECEKYSWRPDDVAKERCKAAVELAENIEGSIIVLGAGCENLCMGRSVPSLSASMERYIVEVLNFDEDRILSNPIGSNTVTETMAMVGAIGGEIRKCDEIYIVSSKIHIPRIKAIFFFGWGILVKSFPAKHETDVGDKLHEVFGIPKSILEILYRKIYGRVKSMLIQKRLMKDNQS